MKKHFILLLLMGPFAAIQYGQAQKLMFNYQGVARDTNNQAFKNQKMEILVEIFEGDTIGNPVFEEIHNVRTSTLGVFNIKVGSAKNSDLSQIDWSSGNSFFLKSTITVGNGAPKTLSAAELVFVPMAIYANLADKANTLVGLKGGAGIDVKGNTITNTGVLTNTLFDGDVSGSYDAVQLKAGIVGTDELSVGAVKSNKIAPGEVKTGNIGDGAVTDVKIAGGIDYTKLSGNGANPNQVLKWSGIAWEPKDDNTATSSSLLAGGTQIMGTLSNLQVKTGVLGSNEIADGTLTNADILDNSIISADIADGTITNADILDGSIIGTDIADGTIGGSDLNPTLNVNATGLTINGGPLILNAVSSTVLQAGLLSPPFFAEYGIVYSPHLHQWSGTNTTETSTLGKLHISAPPILSGDIPTDFSIKASGSIIGTTFFAISDKRVKGNIHRRDNVIVLDNFKALNVVNFSFRDIFNKGNKLHTGFIAQQVEAIFPEAVSRTTDFIPDIYQLARQVHYDPAAHTLALTVDSLTGGLQAGDKVRIIADQQREATVASVQGTTLTVRDWPVPNTTEAFVIGKQVDDFRVVDYDRIFTLNVSATQALIAEVEELKALVSELQAQNAALKGQNITLQTSIGHIEARLQAIVNRLDGASSNTKTGEK